MLVDIERERERDPAYKNNSAILLIVGVLEETI